MAYFYAEKMTYCQCICPRQIAWQVMNRLGYLEIAHFVSHNLEYQNSFVRNLRRCEQSLLKITEVKKFVTQIRKQLQWKEPKNYQQILNEFQKNIEHSNIQGHLYMNEIEDEIYEIHSNIINQKKQLQNRSKQNQQLMNQTALLLTLISVDNIGQILKGKKIAEIHQQQSIQSIFDYKCILINKNDQLLINRGIFRMSRGNAWVQMFEIMKQKIQSIFERNFQCINNKIVSIIIFQKGQANVLSDKINRFLSCIEHTIIYTHPDQWYQQLIKIQSRAKQVRNIQDLSIDVVERYLHKLYEPKDSLKTSHLTYLELYTRKQKQIYKQLACAQPSNNFLHFNIFMPSKCLPLHIQPNQQLPPLIMKVCESDKSPPSKFDAPPILEYPQTILNTYGVPNYDQFNPAVFYIVTFGFFIGVMFGDIGHMLMTIPLLLYFRANIWVWTIVFFMGYCGLIYNEFFGLNIGLFLSCYTIDSKEQITLTDNCVYPIGIDSAWKSSSNYMNFTNSYKMKLAVILGVFHMLLGLSVRLINGFKKRNFIDIFAITIPQIIFMGCTFVYMDFLIIFKWLKYFKAKQAPSIIATMIATFGRVGRNDKRLLFWDEEKQFQTFILIVAALMIPIMLLVKPIIICIKRKPKEQIFNDIDDVISDQLDDKFSQNQLAEDKSHKFRQIRNHNKKSQQESTQEIFVNQFIETIEYILGSISNTASYLRLWALSLAHGQLSEVIFELLLLRMIKGGYSAIPGLLIAFPFFWLVTFGVLICMDSLECFLHSLRLHWVQFQNKFYSGRGYEFQPYSFKKIKIPE